MAIECLARGPRRRLAHRVNFLLKAGSTFIHTEDDPIAGEHRWGTGIGWRF